MCFHAVPELVIVAEWRHVARYIWVSIGSGTGLLLDGTKPLSEPLFTFIQKSPMTVIRQIPRSSISKMNSKIPYQITYLNFLSNLPVTNEPPAGSWVCENPNADSFGRVCFTECWCLIETYHFVIGNHLSQHSCALDSLAPRRFLWNFW